jgi:hypothetical protein
MRPATVLIVLFAALALAFAYAPCSAATAQAASGTASTSQPDARYQWHQGRWWYQYPDSRWVYWESNRWNDYRPQVVLTAQTSETTAAPAAASTGVPCYTSGSSYESRSWAHSAVGSWGGNYFGRPGY